MNYSLIKWRDIADGPGIRVSLFVSGCRHHCKGCFNAETWSFDAGKPYTPEVQASILEGMEKRYILGLTLLGGEPFEPENQPAVLALCRAVREKFPEKTIWCYSGYTLETDILAGRLGPKDITMELLGQLDVLVDGRFVEAQHDISLCFRGSSNQRLLDVPKSLAAKAPVWWEDEQVFATHTM